MLGALVLNIVHVAPECNQSFKIKINVDIAPISILEYLYQYRNTNINIAIQISIFQWLTLHIALVLDIVNVAPE